MIKNPTVFLAAATIISFLSSPVTLAAGNTSPLFKNLEAKVGVKIPAKTVDNADVIYFKGLNSKVDLPAGIKQSFGENFTLQGEFEGNRACVVYTEATTPSRLKFMFDKNGKEALVFDNKEYINHISTHEISHCLNHDFVVSNSPINDLLASREFTDLKLQLRTLDLSIREVHSDLISTLIGASQTGTWSTFGNVILPLRAAKFDPRHATLSSVYRMIEHIEPSDLEGKNLSEVVELGNILFRKNFFNGKSISLNSAGVSSILRDWTASGHEQIFVSERVKTPDTIKAARIVFPYMELAKRILGQEVSDDAYHEKRFYGLKQLALHQQYSMAQLHASEFRTPDMVQDLLSNIKSNLTFLSAITSSNTNRITGAGVMNDNISPNLLAAVKVSARSASTFTTAKYADRQDDGMMR